MAVYEVEILVWDKWNPRKDQKKHSWHRTEADEIYHPAIHKLSHPGYRFWGWLKSMRTKQSSTTVIVDTEYVRRMIRVPPKYVLTSLEVLSEYSICTFRLLASTKKRPLRPKGLKEKSGKTCVLRTNDTNDTNDTNVTTVESEIDSGPVESLLEEPRQKSADEVLAEEWLEYARKEMPWASPPSNWSVEEFATEIAKVREATNLNSQGIEAVLKFVRNDDFWRDKALSPSGLLKKSANNNLRKIDNILSRMKPKESKADRALREYAQDSSPISDDLPF